MEVSELLKEKTEDLRSFPSTNLAPVFLSDFIAQINEQNKIFITLLRKNVTEYKKVGNLFSKSMVLKKELMGTILTSNNFLITRITKMNLFNIFSFIVINFI